ncbi:MAG: hypothetical protein AB7E37_05515 [Candidatus Altimarinota bacterium]
MINFRSVVEFLFKSFDIAGDTKLIEKLEHDGVRFLMVIKRHWIYGILHSWVVIFVLAIAFINAYLLFSDQNNTLMGSIIGVFLLGNVIYWTFIICLYLYRFYKIQGSEPHIEDIYTCIRKSKESDAIFTKFFNQTIFLLLILALITIFSTFTAISSLLVGGATGFGVGAINVILLIVQVGMFSSYLVTMINQEMDFKIIQPGQIIFYNQRGVLGDSQNMNANKIKTMNTKYPGILGSFFNYGDILILTEGDQKDYGEMKMDYVGSPIKTVKEIQKVLNNDLDAMEKDVNLLLKRFKSQIGVEDISSDENKEKLKIFLANNDKTIKEIFDNGDDETKREVKELYILIQK